MIDTLVNWILYSLIGLDPSILWVQSLNFFIYDSIKIILLLFVMIFVLGIIRTYIPHKKLKDFLTRKSSWINNLIASIFGAITPFCSCSSIPIFLSFLKSGIPLGVVFSFLITSPIINEYLVILMLGYFGWKITLAYILSGIIVGVVSGLILGKMNLEKYIEKDFSSKLNDNGDEKYSTLKQRLFFGLREAKTIVKKIWHWILVGVGIGAIIHNYVPQELIQSVISYTGYLAVPLVVLLGVPMYGNCAAIVPIAVALFQKGVPIGTALAFMMAISALSLPEAIILRRAMKLKLILIFFGIVTLAIILTGYLINALQPLLV